MFLKNKGNFTRRFWVKRTLTLFVLSFIALAFSANASLVVNTKNTITKSSYPVSIKQNGTPISEQTLINTLTKILKTNQELKAQLKGEKGDKGDQGPQGVNAPSQFNFGQTVSYQPTPASPQYSSSPIGIYGGFASVGAQEITTNNINVTNNSTFNNITVSGGTTISGNLSVSGTITGATYNPSFTTGSIPFQGLSGLTQDNSNFFWDDTNNRLGVGTSTPSAKIDITTNSLGVTQTNTSGLSLVNTTPAAAGSQQISPAIRWRGYGWKTNATAESRPVDFRAYLIPGQGTANPSGTLRFDASINVGSYSTVFGIGSSGEIFAGSGNPGSSGQVLRSGGLGDSASWSNFSDLLVANFSSGLGTQFTGSSVNLGGTLNDNVIIDTLSFGFKVYDSQYYSGINIYRDYIAIGDVEGLGNITKFVVEDNFSKAYIIHKNNLAYFGINTSEPTAALDVVGSAKIGSGTGTGLFTELEDGRTTIGDWFGFGNSNKIVVNNNQNVVEIFAEALYTNASFQVNTLISCGGIQTNASGVMSCTSDETLKNIKNPFTKGLDAIRLINPQSYSWKEDSGLYDGGAIYNGFIAQNIQQALPEAISLSYNNKLQVSQITLLAASINAIKELDTKTEKLYSLDINKGDTLGSLIKKYLEDAMNGLEKIFVKEVRTEKLCVGNTCVTEGELIELLQRNNLNQSPNSTSSEDNTNQQEEGATNMINIDVSVTESTISPEEVTIIEVLEGGEVPISTE